MPPLRPRPGIDETREMLRKHDERVEEELEHETPPASDDAESKDAESEDAESGEGDEEEPETPH